MAVLSSAQAAAYLRGAGMPATRVTEFVAIAECESSLDTAAVSPVGAIGLWQIMPFNAGPFGFTPGQLYDPAVNARVAVGLSGHGSNCAAWDTCYADIARSGRYRFLGWPEQGSCAFAHLGPASVRLGTGKQGFTAGPQPATVGADIAPALAQIQTVLHKRLPVLARLLTAEGMAISRQFTKGWRP